MDGLTVLLVVGFDKEKYTCRQIHVRSHDNKSIPVTLIHQKNLQMNGR
jgi:oligopeptidase B